MTPLFFIATLVLYFAGTVSFLAYLLRRSEALSKVSLGLAGLGFLASGGGNTGRLPLRMPWMGCRGRREHDRPYAPHFLDSPSNPQL